MNLFDTTILAAIVAGIFSIIGSILALRGRESEVKSNHTQTLITGQDNRIARLEARLDKVEKRLWAEVGRSASLASALEVTVSYILAMELYLSGGMVGKPPKAPDVAHLRSVLESARNPPVDAD